MEEGLCGCGEGAGTWDSTYGAVRVIWGWETGVCVVCQKKKGTSCAERQGGPTVVKVELEKYLSWGQPAVGTWWCSSWRNKRARDGLSRAGLDRQEVWRVADFSLPTKIVRQE